MSFTIGVASVLIGSVALVAAVKNSKNIKKIFKFLDITTEKPTVSPTDIDQYQTQKNQVTIARLDRLIEECETWHNRYVEERKSHQKTLSILSDVQYQLQDVSKRLKVTEREVKTLRYIVDKMDGKQIIRDENNHITGVKLKRVK